MAGPDSGSSASPDSAVIDACPARSGPSSCRTPTRATSPGNNTKRTRRRCARVLRARVGTAGAAHRAKGWRYCKGSSSAADAATACRFATACLVVTRRRTISVNAGRLNGGSRRASACRERRSTARSASSCSRPSPPRRSMWPLRCSTSCGTGLPRSIAPSGLRSPGYGRTPRGHSGSSCSCGPRIVSWPTTWNATGTKRSSGWPRPKKRMRVQARPSRRQSRPR